MIIIIARQTTNYYKKNLEKHSPGRKLENPSTVKTPTYEEQKAQVEKNRQEYEQREQEDAQKLKNWKPQPSIQQGNIPNNASGLK